MIERFAALGAVLGGSWLVWSRILSLLFLPAQAVYMMKQQQLENARTEFLKKCKGASRVAIPVLKKRLSPLDWAKRLVKWMPAEPTTDANMDGFVMASLDGIEIPAAVDRPTEKADNVRYLVHMNANGVCYEEKLDSMLHLQRAFVNRGWDCNMLVFNYRGVGHSSGKILSGDDLVKDACSVIRWLVQVKKVKPCNILVHGHSIGGAAAVLACASVASMNSVDGDAISLSLGDSGNKDHPFILADRTFDDLEAVVKDKLGAAFDMSPIGAIIFANAATLVLSIMYVLYVPIRAYPGVGIAANIMGGILASIVIQSAKGEGWPIRSIVQKRYKASKLHRRAAFFLIRCLNVGAFSSLISLGSPFGGPPLHYILLASGLGYFLGSRGLLNGFALRLVSRIGWRMQPSQAWKSLETSRKTVTYHASDEMIPATVSLANHSEINQQFALKGHYGSPHMYDFFLINNEASQILDRIGPFFSNSRTR